jgi:hypothetical protein
VLENANDVQEKLKLIRKFVTKTSTANVPDASVGYRLTELPRSGVWYVAPGPTQNQKFSVPTFLQNFAADTAIRTLDDLIYIQGKENAHRAAKALR